MLDNIIDGLKPLAIDIASLTPDPDNARRHSDRNLDAIARSLSQFGQRKPIVVQKQGMVVRAGNGTLDAAQRLGWKQIAAVIVDEDSAEAAAFAIADNRTGELAEWDHRALAATLTALNDNWVDYDPHLLGFDEGEVARLMADFAPFDAAGDPPIATVPGEAEPKAAPPKKTKAAPEQVQLPDPVAPQTTGVQAVQLFLDPTQHEAVLEDIRALSAHFQTTNVTDTVIRALQSARKSHGV